MDIENIVENLKVKEKSRFCNNFKIAMFLDKSKRPQFVTISIKEKETIAFNCYNKNLERTAFLNIDDYYNQKVYLRSIYVLKEYRSCGIAKQMHNLMQYCISNNFFNNDEKKMIYGYFEPQQMGEDRANSVYCSQKELNSRAKTFYLKAGYSIINIDNLLRYSDLFDKLLTDEETLRDIEECRMYCDDYIVYKALNSDSKNYGYEEKNGLLIHESFSKLDERVNTIKK